MRSSNNITAVIIFFILKATQILRKLNLYKISSFHKGLNIAAGCFLFLLTYASFLTIHIQSIFSSFSKNLLEKNIINLMQGLDN